MSMISMDMASQMKSALSGCTGGGIYTMWDSICDYVESNADVMYSWTAVSTSVPPVTDTTVMINAGIDTSGGRVLNVPGLDQATDANTALGIITVGMNQAASGWTIKWPQGFILSPCYVIPSIVLTPSMKTEQLEALDFICSQVIGGINAATPGTMGIHLGVYQGGGSFISIV